MRKRGVCDIFVVLYANYWYIPLLALLIGMKLCVVMMIVSNKLPAKEGNSAGRRYLAHKSSLNSGVTAEMEKMNSEAKGNSEGKISPETIENWRILLNLEKYPIKFTSANRTDVEGIWLIFNQVPNCSGEQIVNLLMKVSKTNNFVHQTHEYRTPWYRFLLEQEQENLVNWFEYQHLPKSYDRHFFFVNFTFFQRYIKQNPIYINLIREPAMRLKSGFEAKRFAFGNRKLEISRRNKSAQGSGLDWYQMTFENCVLMENEECAFKNGTEDFTMSVPFFCGQHHSCVLINNKWALQRAKFVIEKYYSVVGILENLEESIHVFEKYIPKFFRGASTTKALDRRDVHKAMNIKILRIRQSELSSKVRRILEKKLPNEFELYRFVKQRLQLQHSFLKETENRNAINEVNGKVLSINLG